MDRIAVALGLSLSIGVIHPGIAGAEVIQLNFGSNSGVANWNEFNSVGGDVATIANVVYDDGTFSGYSFSIDTPFHSINTNGTTAPTAPASNDFPSAVTKSSYFGNAVPFGDPSETRPSASLTFAGLNPNSVYEFVFFSSRMGVSDNRETTYTVTGSTGANTSIDAANNASAVAVVSGIAPDLNNQISIVVTYGLDNDNSNKFYYLNGLVINETVPEPSSALLSMVGFGFLCYRRRRTQ